MAVTLLLSVASASLVLPRAPPLLLSVASASLVLPRAPPRSPPLGLTTVTALTAEQLRAPPPRLSAATVTEEDRLLALVAPTDAGVAATDEQRTEIAALIEQLEAGWRGTDCFAYESQLLQRTQVVYVGQSSSKKANAAGGRYRGRIGHFRTDYLLQHVLPDAAVNVIAFRLFGLIPGAAVLKGTWSKDFSVPSTVLVSFDPPRLAFGRRGGALPAAGPKTSVGLESCLSPRMRICRGATSRTAFVFDASSCAGGALEVASQEWSDVVARQPLGRAGGRRYCGRRRHRGARLAGAAARAAAVGARGHRGIEHGRHVVDRKPKAA